MPSGNRQQQDQQVGVILPLALLTLHFDQFHCDKAVEMPEMPIKI